MKKEKDYIKILEKAIEEYYRGTPIMTDEEFDNIFDEFKAVFPKSSFFSKVGHSTSNKQKLVKHEIQMGSLLKINNQDELSFWFKKYAKESEVIWSEKIDGLSVSLYYEDGIFKKAVTRGDGIQGEDITENAKKMNFLKKLNEKYTGYIRGEIVLLKDIFEKKYQDKANPRNVAAGLVRRLDGKGSEDLSIFCYFIEKSEDEEDSFKKIKSLGLKTPKFGSCKTEFEINNIWQSYEKELREKSTYEIDGICLTVKDFNIQKELGSVDNRPKYSRAYKFSPQSSISIIEDIVWQVGRSGRITPVAKIKPVNVSGALISNVSLHNIAEIKRKNININCVIRVERKGDVIPQIVECINNSDKNIDIIENCPSCNSKLRKEDIFLFCDNNNCREKNILSLLFWLKTLDIKGFGDKMVEKLYDNGIVTKIKDFYSLKQKHISDLERSGDILAEKLINEINSKKEVYPEILLKGIGIEDFGERTAKLILDKYSLDEIFRLKKDELLQIDGIGPETAERVVIGLKNKKREIESLIKILTVKEKNKSGILSGEKICFTGFRDKDLSSFIESNGGEVLDSYSKKVSILLIKDKDSSSSKIDKAKKDKVKILTLDEFNLIYKK